jgi:hypothetical protein
VWQGACYVLLSRPNGKVQGPLRVLSGGSARTLVFPNDGPDFDVQTGTEMERTRYAFGTASEYAKLCLVTGIRPGAGGKIQYQCVVEDNRVHSADADYVGGGGSGGGGGSNDARIAHAAPDNIPSYNAASDEQRAFYGFAADADGNVGAEDDPGYISEPG